MTVEQEILEKARPIIEKLAKSRSIKGSFAYYEKTDVYQEIWCMCLEALDRYNPAIGPIENYLSRHISNRMKNLKRDKYFRPGCDMPSSGLAKTRMNLVNALSLNTGDIAEKGVLLCSQSINTNPLDRILCKETLEYIMEKIPKNLMNPLNELINNNKVRHSLVIEIRQTIAEILTERDCYG